MHTKRVIFLALPLLFVPLVYGFSSTSDACAAPNEAPTGAQCWTSPLSDSPGNYVTTCCWTEADAEGIEIEYCQHCDYDPSTGTHSGCGEAHPVGAQPPTPTPPGRVPPGVLKDLPTLEQVPATPPPLFGGGNDANVPPSEGIEQPPTSAPLPKGQSVLPQGGVLEQLQTGALIPLYDPGLVLPPIGEETTKPQLGAPELPPTGEQSTGPILDQNKAAGPILDPELADEALPPITEGEQGQVLSKDDDDDDDGPVPPECPLTGPIPPDCTMKPKFPTENALE